MVKYNTPKSLFKYHFKNLSGSKFNLLIEKCKYSMNIIIEHEFVFSIFDWIPVILVVIISQFVDYKWVIICICVLILLVFYKVCNIVKEETLTVSKSLGYQITTRYLLGEKSLFMPYNQVQHIFINEVIYKRQVIYVLTIKTINNKDYSNNKLIPLFFDTKPRLYCLQLIYNQLENLRHS